MVLLLGRLIPAMEVKICPTFSGICFSTRDSLLVQASMIKIVPSYFQVVPLWFLSEARGTTGSRRRVLPQDLTLLSAPKPHLGADLPDLLDHCVALGEEVIDMNG